MNKQEGKLTPGGRDMWENPIGKLKFKFRALGSEDLLTDDDDARWIRDSNKLNERTSMVRLTVQDLHDNFEGVGDNVAVLLRTGHLFEVDDIPEAHYKDEEKEEGTIYVLNMMMWSERKGEWRYGTISYLDPNQKLFMLVSYDSSLIKKFQFVR